MAKRIDEVWYAYNAKGVKIPPYKSKVTKRISNSLVSRVLRMFKSNGLEIVLSISFGLLIFSALIFALIKLLQ